MIDPTTYFQCQCGAALVEDSAGLCCDACKVVWPKHGNIIDLHPGSSLQPVSTPVGPLKALHLVPLGNQPIEAAWLERCTTWVKGDQASLRLVRRWEVLFRSRWSVNEGVALFCQETGELSLIQQWAAFRARRGVVLKCYPLGTWEWLTPKEIRTKVVNKLLRLGVAPFDLLKMARKRWYIHHTLTQPRLAEAFYARYCPLNGRTQQVILDMGCGWGRYAGLLANLGHTVIGLDPQVYPKIWQQIPRSWFCRGTDADLVHLRSQSVDGCLCVEVLQYLQDDRWTLQELHRILKPGGWLLIEVTNRDNPWTQRTGQWLLPGDPVRRYYRQAELLQLVESVGFKVERSWGEGLVSPVFPRLAAFFIDVLLARWLRRLEDYVSAGHRKLLWILATKERE